MRIDLSKACNTSAHQIGLTTVHQQQVLLAKYVSGQMSQLTSCASSFCCSILGRAITSSPGITSSVITTARDQALAIIERCQICMLCYSKNVMSLRILNEIWLNAMQG